MQEGVLPSQEILQLVSSAQLRISDAERHLQPNSIDLPLGKRCWRLRSVRLPRKTETVSDVIKELAIDELDLEKPTIFERNATYVIELDAECALPHDLHGDTDSKSSTGRIDVQTRLLTDHNERYDFVPEGYRGKLYLFVSSNSFLIRVRRGIALNQLRLTRGDAVLDDTAARELALTKELVYVGGKPSTSEGLKLRNGIIMRLDLREPIAGYRAKFTNAVVDLARLDNPSEQFWERIEGPLDSITLEKGQFYILSTLEHVRIPHSHTAWIPPFRPEFGEFRSHYAGFYDAGFGFGEGELHGATTTLEVRSHDNSLTLLHGTPVAPLLFLRLTDVPERIYGRGMQNNYQRGNVTQHGPKLAKYFN